MHYLFDLPAPYPLWSLPKLLGVPGGLLLTVGTLWMAALKLQADRNLRSARAWGGEMAFILLLCLVAVSGLALYGAGTSQAMPVLLAGHLGSVLSFFLLTPFTKMAHGFYRLAGFMYLQYEGTGRGTQNLVLTARRAVKTTSGAIRRLQNQIGQILAPPTSGLFQQPQPGADIRRNAMPGGCIDSSAWFKQFCSAASRT